MKFRKKLEKIFSNKVISYSVKNIFKFAKGKKTCWCNLESRRSTGSFLFQKKKKKFVHYNVHDFISSPAKLASLSADKLFSFRQTYFFQFTFILQTFFSFFFVTGCRKTGCGWRHKKRKVFLVRKSFRATVLLGSFNLIFKSFLRRESCSTRSFLSLTSRQVVTFD